MSPDSVTATRPADSRYAALEERVMAYVFDLGNPATNANPFPEFARLRVEDPVHWSPAMKAWIITRYADVKQVALNNKQISADRLTPFFKANPEYQRGAIESLVRYLNHWMVFRDPPDHTRLRRLFTKAFTPTAVENLRPNIEDIVGHLIDGMATITAHGAWVLPVVTRGRIEASATRRPSMP